MLLSSRWHLGMSFVNPQPTLQCCTFQVPIFSNIELLPAVSEFHIVLRSNRVKYESDLVFEI
jgi:hypothetical protein